MHLISETLILVGVLVLVWRFDRTLLLILSELRRLADQLEHIALLETREQASAASHSSPSPE